MEDMQKALAVMVEVTEAEAAVGYLKKLRPEEEVVVALAEEVKVETDMVPALVLRQQMEAVVQPDITEDSAIKVPMVVSAVVPERTMVPVAEVMAVVAALMWAVEEAAESVWRLCRRGGRLATLPYGCLMKAPVKSVVINVPVPVGLKYP